MSIALIVVLFLSSVSAQDIRYVRPSGSPSYDCPGQPCFTLHQYIIEQTTRYFTNGSTFIFLPGNHTLQIAARISSVSNVTLRGESGVAILLGTEISCTYITNLVIFRLKFLLAFDDIASDMSAWSIKQSGNIFIDSSIFEGSTGYKKISGRALKLKNSNVRISNCLFESNTGNNGGAIYAEKSTVLVNSSTFSRNRAYEEGGALLALYSKIILHSSTFTGNRAEENGGAIYMLGLYSMLVFNGSLHIIFKDNTAGGDGGAIFNFNSRILSTAGKITFLNNTAKDFGGAVRLCADIASVEMFIAANFINNTAGTCGGAASVLGDDITFEGTLATGNSDSAFCVSGDLHFIGTTNFSKNTGELGGAIYIHPESHVLFIGNTVFDGNSAVRGGAIYALNAVKVVFYMLFLSLASNEAQAEGGAIYSFGANFTFLENTAISIHHNSAQNGGAMYLTVATSMMFSEGVNLSTTHNYARQYGGVIYYEDATTATQCKYKSQDTEVSEFHQLPFCPVYFAFGRDSFGFVHVNCFVNSCNDSSGIDGSFMYGGLLDRCQIGTKHWLSGQDGAVVPFEIVLKDFQFQPFSSVRTITSQPYQLCFCNNVHTNNCTGTMNVVINIGQMFAISLLALDQVRTSVSTQVTGRVRRSGRLKSTQSHQTLPPNCSELKYTLYSTGDSEELILYPDGPCRDNGLARAVVNVTLLPCPHGFIQSMDKCVCEGRLEKYGADCTIDEDVSITRGPDSRLWMSALYDNITYQGLILYHTCPVEYCTMEIVPVDLDNPDIQCANDRSGMLCGACATNYSLMLGSYRCGECSNTYLALLLPFASAGIALVVFLSILRLTVATGMINGVILYANIIQVNKDIFFPTSIRNANSVFIAWMNLDLGFEACFYNGMTTYQQTWFQFAFPVYVWILIIVIILTSRYSITVSKLIGHNPIAVLATLLLMSYTKILNIIIEVYSSVDLDYPQNKIVAVWLKDANIPYLQSWHLFLTVVTSLVLIFLFLPYTLLLVLGYRLYRYSGKRYLHWLNRLKPLLDSYYAPYKIHTRYWTGFLLLVRCFLYMVFSFNPLGGMNKSLLTIIISFSMIGLSTGYLTSGKIYSKLHVSIMETSIYLNLIVLSAITLAGLNSTALVHSLVGIVFVTMIGIIVYHFHITYTAKSAMWLKVHTRMTISAKRLQELFSTSPPPTDAPVYSSSHDPHEVVTKTIIKLREPLLEMVN